MSWPLSYCQVVKPVAHQQQCGAWQQYQPSSARARSHHSLAGGNSAEPLQRVQVTVTMRDGRQLTYTPGRRDALQRVLLGGAILGQDNLRWMWDPSSASAGLLQFPTARLNNSYFLVRAGEGQSEADKYVLTNPVAKTSMDSGLSSRGKQQVVRETAAALKDLGALSGSCWMWPSITQRSYQTAEILASLFALGQSRIVPEYSFLDPRGLGALGRAAH
eukprot:jgi/Botrbrau1/5175/Bobra.0172s0046.1